MESLQNQITWPEHKINGKLKKSYDFPLIYSL